MLFGLPIGLVTALLVTLIMRQVLRGRFWKPATDEEVDEAMAEQEVQEVEAVDAAEPGAPRQLPLITLFLPILVPLLLIAGAAFLQLAGLSNPFIAFLGNGNIALFIGLLIAYLLARVTQGADKTEKAVVSGFHTTGEILLITGVGGSLGEVIKRTGLDDVLGSADAGASVVVVVVLAWVVAAVLHAAIGSVSVGAITAAGILGPILGSLDVAPIAVGLAIASGAMFALHVNSNFFWMFKGLLGLSTAGALKTLTMGTSIGSIVSLPIVMMVALLVPK